MTGESCRRNPHGGGAGSFTVGEVDGSGGLAALGFAGLEGGFGFAPALGLIWLQEACEVSDGFGVAALFGMVEE